MAKFRIGNGARQSRDALAILRRFGRNEDGTLVIFALMLTLLMMMMGGIAVDVMRYETVRTSLQNTLDRSTLAAAALTQGLHPEAVVNDYFLRAGLADELKSVTVTEGLNFRNVAATALATTNPLFMQMLGIDQLDAGGASTAEQRISNVEIMLVLDVSGSMASNSKIQNLKSAANQFISTVLGKDTDHRISIGLVPFNGQINLGTTLLSQYNATMPNAATVALPNLKATDVNCVDLPVGVYDYTAMSSSLALPMTANADTYSGTNQTTSYVTYTDTSYATPSVANEWCPAKPGNIVRMPQQDIATLQGYINGLTAIGATSINAGLKWGVTLMDPDSRSMFTTLIGANAMPASMAGRPFAYQDSEAMKVIVLMTDGTNFPEDRVNPGYKAGLSKIYRGTSDNNYSIYQDSKVVTTSAATIAASRPYYVPHLGAWHSRPWNGTVPVVTDPYVPTATITGANEQTWPQVWGNLRLSYVAWQFYARPLGATSAARTSLYSTWMNNFRTKTDAVDNTPTMDAQLQSMCTLAKNQNVIIYGIAFEAPSNGQTQIRNCSTSPAHYFNAQGLQIATAFTAIANNISQLRLTQ